MRTYPIFLISAAGVSTAAVLAGLGTALTRNYILVVPAIIIGPSLVLLIVFRNIERSLLRERIQKTLQGLQRSYGFYLLLMLVVQCMFLYVLVESVHSFNYHICDCPVDAEQLKGWLYVALAAGELSLLELPILYGIFIAIYGLRSR